MQCGLGSGSDGRILRRWAERCLPTSVRQTTILITQTWAPSKVNMETRWDAASKGRNVHGRRHEKNMIKLPTLGRAALDQEGAKDFDPKPVQRMPKTVHITTRGKFTSTCTGSLGGKVLSNTGKG